MAARATGGSLTDAIAALLRPEEERFLEAALGAVESRRSVVELIGEPGSGKTRLLGAFCELAAERGWAVLRSSGGVDGEPGVRCQMFVEALRSRLADRTAEENREPVAQLMRNLATGPFPATGGASSLEDGRCQTFSAMSGMLSDWAGARGGLVIVLDDVHAADQGSLELLEYLVRWPTEQPIALVIAHRPAQSPAGLRALLAEGADYGTSVSVELGPLNLAQAARLTGHPAGSDALRILHHMSDGVPLYLLTLDRWRSEHVGRFSGDGWLTEGSALPVAFTARIRGELASLDAEERAVALAAVMLGTTFDLGGVSIASGLPERTVCRVLEQLRRPDLIRDAPNGDSTSATPCCGASCTRNPTPAGVSAHTGAPWPCSSPAAHPRACSPCTSSAPCRAAPAATWTSCWRRHASRSARATWAPLPTGSTRAFGCSRWKRGTKPRPRTGASPPTGPDARPNSCSSRRT
ncbi:AAA family ATPase [Streptomyces sp. RKAG290]|uniref:AAA family ATPase n=1 Tax=Streptomyces sp. RKAG290 TaxID=2888348 RepID=UPI0020347C7C|nr:AAA family ATPase [Streptomyces sp. RKAG290]MCM2410718.1 AAA family ATPase [Streptomyces sp. RKAG290]